MSEIAAPKYCPFIRGWCIRERCQFFKRTDFFVWRDVHTGSEVIAKEQPAGPYDKGAATGLCALAVHTIHIEVSR